MLHIANEKNINIRLKDHLRNFKNHVDDEYPVVSNTYWTLTTIGKNFKKHK